MHYSPLESQRFNLRVLRGNTDKLDVASLLEIIKNQSADIAILRIPSTEQHTLHQLNELSYPFIVADTLVYYDCDLQANPAKPLRNNDLEARLATPADQPLLETLVDLIFKDYSTHYYSNPLFNRQRILDGYKEWTLNYLEPTAGQRCFLFYRNEQAIAFATCSLHSNHGEGILYGVHPNSQGGGIYGDLIRYTKMYMHEQGLTKMKVSTQVQNYAVQKVWVREGFFLTQSFCTLHINAMLGKRTNM